VEIEIANEELLNSAFHAIFIDAQLDEVLNLQAPTAC
jgi:hypothetical protein